MKFAYTQYSDTTLRPVIPIVLHHDAVAADYTVLVDSGADINVFAYELGEHLGIDVPSGVAGSFVGVTGQAEEFYIHPVRLEVGGQVITVEAGFAKSMDQKPYGIVGQRGFFDQFRVTFDLPAEVIELTSRRGRGRSQERGKAA